MSSPIPSIEDRLADVEATIKLFRTVMNDVYVKFAELKQATQFVPVTISRGDVSVKYEPPTPNVACCS